MPSAILTDFVASMLVISIRKEDWHLIRISKLTHSCGQNFCHVKRFMWHGVLIDGLHVFPLIHSFSSGFAELSADLVEAAVAHCQLIVVSK